MKVIVPIYKKRISPVFDWCMRAVVVEVQSGNTVNREEIDLSVLNEFERIEKVVDLDAETMLCGGISMQLEGVMTFRGIQVISWISGNVDEIINRFINGTLFPQQWLMPGVRKVRKMDLNSESNLPEDRMGISGESKEKHEHL